ncbi:hypothetical protein [Pelosinus propionicus]|uniref:Uncharacterized protein n=1 Tax=Pelosinus propionicus DSM 13327 TaxID=1123291 RepID=A0A1I4P727_9FIRM|nr:hypothetical protein [Pelosinus propionicus]SFM23347.1 hypothetical protein SAMN04490355_105823 [Pelosinus propionicus DSM 13327]
MSNENPNTLFQSIAHMIDNVANEGTGYDTLIHLLSLLCILHILNRTQPMATAPMIQNSSTIAANNSTNPLHKLLGELTKSSGVGDGGGGGPTPDMLMSLLPLLNNPQIKSKLNPANISSILGVLGNLGVGGNSDKQEGNKIEKSEKKDPPAAAVTSSLANSSREASLLDTHVSDKKDLGRSLNWKTTFENEKEV